MDITSLFSITIIYVVTMKSRPIIFVILIIFQYCEANCPANCKKSVTCTEEDSGCPVCNRKYYGRQCQYRTECRYNAIGRKYRGLRNTTSTGRTCQRWDSQTPHTHKWSGEENYCRNPDSSREPWCYTTDTSKRFEYCNIPLCSTHCPIPDFNAPFVDITNPPSEGFAINFTAIFGCVLGYEHIGTYSATCFENKTWSSSALPACSIVECPPIQLNKNNRIENPGNKTKYVYEDKITVACDSGYSVQGQTELTCQADKTWNSVPPTCEINKCPTPMLNWNSSILNPKNTYEYKDIIQVECDIGFTIQGPEVVECQANETWSTIPSCKINECSEPVLDIHANISNARSVYQYKDMITIVCSFGYTLQGQAEIMCEENVTWTPGVPTCKVNECPEPNPNANSRIINQKPIYEFMDEITIVCNTGFTLEGQSELICQANKTWDNSVPTCKKNECPEPNLKSNSRIINQKPIYEFMDEITIACNTGFTLEGESKLICQANETWDNSVPTCKMNECQPPKLGPRSNITEAKPSYQYQEIITIICEIGFVIQGSSKLTCQADKQWDFNPPTCKAVECKPPSLSTQMSVNGAMKISYIYGETIVLSCDEGYQHHHGNTAICEASKKWSEPFPVCKGIPGSRTVTIVGGICGSVFAIVLVLIAVYVYQKRKNKPREKENNPVIACNTGKDINETTVNIYADLNDVSTHNRNTDQTSNEETYYNMGPTEVRGKVKICDFQHYVRTNKEDRSHFEAEFKSLPTGLQRPAEVAMRVKNRPKNKYKNIYPYDDNRIELELKPGVPDSDFINASPIKGYDGKIKYIAAQGPQKVTHCDFWTMVLEQNINVIVMLTNAFENGTSKCVQYWPEEDPLQVEDMTIELQSMDEFSFFTVRLLKLTKADISKFIYQYHFTAWPDKSVPKCPSVLARFHKKVFDTSFHRQGPILVHCSAGIGRTGTFISLDYLLDEASSTGSVSVLSALKSLRQQRVNMVQTLEQYIFLHDVLLNALEFKSHLINVDNFSVTYKLLQTRNKATGKTGLQYEYEALNESTPHIAENAITIGKREQNKQKNRYNNILPTDSNRVYLSGSNVDETYINAVYLPGHRDRRAYIITQAPLPNTMEDFWKMIFDENITSIVMLNKKHEEDIYWPISENDPAIFGDIGITLCDKETDGDFQTFSFEVRRDQEKRVIKQFQSLFWRDEEPTPTSTSPVLKLIDAVKLWTDRNGHGSILVHCMNGADKSGLFCTAMSILDMLKEDQYVVIQHIIKQFRTIRPRIISSFLIEI